MLLETSGTKSFLFISKGGDSLLVKGDDKLSRKEKYMKMSSSLYHLADLTILTNLVAIGTVASTGSCITQ